LTCGGSCNDYRHKHSYYWIEMVLLVGCNRSSSGSRLAVGDDETCTWSSFD
jgi:hypothetical protein